MNFYRPEGQMKRRLGDQLKMPDVPALGFVGALSEMWFQISYAAYHFAYVRVYSQSAGLQTDISTLRLQDSEIRMNAQTDVLICRTHLAAFFWQLEDLFEALRAAIKRGKTEQPETQYFCDFEKLLDEIDLMPIRKEIRDYRNMSHQVPAIIGICWESPNKFHHLFLPNLIGHPQREDADLNTQLQEYFEFAANVWFSFAPSDLKDEFPRDFTFPVTIPGLYLGELPIELRAGPHLQVSVQSDDKQ